MKTYLAKVNGFYEPDEIFYVGEDIEKAKSFYKVCKFHYEFEVEVWENGKVIGRYVPAVTKPDKEKALEYRDNTEKETVRNYVDEDKYEFYRNEED